MYRIEADGVEIFNPNNMNTLPVTEAQMSEQLNEAGALRFTLAHGHPKYGDLEGMASYITAYNDDDVIFYGRVMETPLPSFSGLISYECEGALSFLNDSEVTPSKNAMTKTAQEFFEWCIAQHNADIGNDSRRTFEVGNVTVSEKNKSEKYQVSSFTQTKSAIENNLLNVYGGYLKVRVVNGHRYIDWLENYSSNLNQSPITIGINIVERSFTMSGENLFTVLRPVGKNGLLLDNPTINVFSSSQINNKYGRIIKSVSFNDAATKAALQTKANEYIARIKKTLLCTGSIKMVDMHYLDNTVPTIHLGDRFNNLEGLNGAEMTICSLERDFMNPAIDECSFGNERSLNDSSSRGASSLSKGTSRARSSAGQNFKHIIELQETVTINAETLNLHGQTLNEHYELINQSASDYIRLSHDVESWGERVTSIEGTGVIQNSEQLTEFAGQFRIRRDSQGHVIGLEFVEGTEVRVDSNGQMVSVGQRLHYDEEHLQTIEGSALWTQRDNITGFVGEFDIVEDPETHKRTLVIKSGGGMKIRRDNVEYGIYQTPAGEDSAVLTGGLIVNKINNQTETQIRGDRVVLGSELSEEDLNSWAVDAKNGTGVFAKYLTVKKLTASQIETMFLDAEFSSLLEVDSDVLTANSELRINPNGSIVAESGGGGTHYDADGLVVAAWKSNDGKTLYLQTLDGETITFEKAASGEGKFSGTWSGGILTIATDPNGYSRQQYELARGGVNWASDYKSCTVVIDSIRYNDAGSSGYRQQGVANIWVDTSDSYDAGRAQGKLDVTINGAYRLNPVSGEVGTVRTIYFDTVGRSPTSTKQVDLFLTQGNFSNHKKWISLHTESTTGTQIAKIEVDATAEYTAGQTAGKNGVTISGWRLSQQSGAIGSSRTIYVDTVNGPSPPFTREIPLYMSMDSSFSNHGKYVYAGSGYTAGTTYAKIFVDASSEYNDGKYFGFQNVRVTNPLDSMPSGYTVGLSKTLNYTTNGTRDLYFRVSRLKDDGSGYEYNNNSKQVYHLTLNINVPTGTTYSHNATLYCSNITTNNNGIKTVTLMVDYGASQSVPFTKGSSKRVYFN